MSHETSVLDRPAVDQLEMAPNDQPFQGLNLVERLLTIGDHTDKDLRGLAKDTDEYAAGARGLSPEALRQTTTNFKNRLAAGETLDDLLPEAYACVGEAARRVRSESGLSFDKLVFNRQVMTGATLHQGKIAEMATGEGKTLAATMPAYLNALTGKNVHVVTVNDHLAVRDARLMKPVYGLLGMSVGVVVEGLPDSERQRSYAANITYGTNDQFCFDYLGDNSTTDPSKRVQRGLNCAIVDEVDSILIDEARTPVILTGKAEKTDEAQQEEVEECHKFAYVAELLTPDQDYEVEIDRKKRALWPSEKGVAKVEKLLKLDNLYSGSNSDQIAYVIMALKAKEFYQRDRDYVVEDGEIKIVNEFTGRTPEGQRWGEGLHQAVEAKEAFKAAKEGKERMDVKTDRSTLATITRQNYFRLYNKLAGMTGTAMTSAKEFNDVYGLQAVEIPTAHEMIRRNYLDRVYKTERAKFAAVVKDIVARHKKGQPMLVGTASIEKSEQLSALLTEQGIPHKVLNAKKENAEMEAEVIAQAGQLGAVTIATNMAGRGVDIMLGGNAEALAKHDLAQQGIDVESATGQAMLAQLIASYKEDCDQQGQAVRDLGGLYVIGTARHESRRIDDQLRGRSGRQGDEGESRFYLSLEDDLLSSSIAISPTLKRFVDRTLPNNQPITYKIVTQLVEKAQAHVEVANLRIRQNIFKYDKVKQLQQQRVYAERTQVLEGEDLEERVHDMFAIAAEALANPKRDFLKESNKVVGKPFCEVYPSRLTTEQLESYKPSQRREVIAQEMQDFYSQLEEQLRKNPLLPEDAMSQLQKLSLLSAIDHNWRKHLLELDEIREGIHLRAYVQKDPLVEFQHEADRAFQRTKKATALDFVRLLLNTLDSTRKVS